jgi:hypothetical protein
MTVVPVLLRLGYLIAERNDNSKAETYEDPWAVLP